MHFCTDELVALSLLIPGVRYFLVWFRTVWKKRHEKPTCIHENGHEEKASEKSTGTEKAHQGCQNKDHKH